MNIPSSLTRHQPRTPTSPEELQRMRARAWLEQGVVIIPIDDPTLPLNAFDRQQAENVANKLYGRRNR